jgi:Serine protease inhibitor
MEEKIPGIWILVVAVLFCVIVVAGCTVIPVTNTTPDARDTTPVTPEVTPPAGTAQDTPAYEKSVADANNRFAYDLYSKLGSDPEHSGSNLFFSPFSISSAMAIAFEGARGETADEIQAVFHFPADALTRREGFLHINAGIHRNDPEYTLRTANALWAEKTCPFMPGYISTAEQYYGANTTNLDFIGQPEPSRTVINNWVEEKTAGKIKDLLPTGIIRPLTRLIITNALYFKGDWVKQFDPDKTADAAFRTASGENVVVPMMQRTDMEALYNYTETDHLQFLEMPYAHGVGNELSMLVILPKGDNLMEVENSLDIQMLSDLENVSHYQRVDVYFPKFRLETTSRLSRVLASMGMPAAFTMSADLSGMDGTQFLYIDEVVHKAYIDVNEEGTEAAAATAVVVSGKGVVKEPVPKFRADHPFIFIIRDNETGAILFMGRVADPSVS